MTAKVVELVPAMKLDMALLQIPITESHWAVAQESGDEVGLQPTIARLAPSFCLSACQYEIVRTGRLIK
jgi:hypothetical protein